MGMAPARRLVMTSRMQKLTTWEMAVAMAAPAVPRFSPKISSGSSTMFSTPPLAMPIIP